MDAYLSLLDTDGTLVYPGIPDQSLSVGVFCALHGIGADVEVVDAEARELAGSTPVEFRDPGSR